MVLTNRKLYLKTGQKNSLLITAMLCLGITAVFAQFSIRFKLINVPANHRQDTIFAAGNFNNWNPAEIKAGIAGLADTAFIEVKDLPAGPYQFKFTRGGWQRAEVAADGKDVANRELNLVSDTTVAIGIDAWKDDFPAIIKRHTASKNVRIIDTAFYIPQLKRTRRIWLYLPPGYAKSKKHYPVMYMQDGQNIFDEYTADFGEWGVDETVDSMSRLGKPACIIVGIDNGPKSLNEYNPFNFKEFGNGEGDEYLEFIVKTLKPFVDKHYRTLPNNYNTIIAGSSMGGLIAYYAMLKYPKVFGKAGIFSPAFWTAEKIKELTELKGKNITGTLFFYMGGKEGGRYTEDMEAVTDELGKNSIALIYVVTDPESAHNEQAWRKWFPEFYNWVLANGFNNIIDVEE